MEENRDTWRRERVVRLADAKAALANLPQQTDGELAVMLARLLAERDEQERQREAAQLQAQAEAEAREREVRAQAVARRSRVFPN